MTTTAITCPWWCTDHRRGDTLEDEQHAQVFWAQGDTWVEVVLGTLPADRPEIAYGAEAYDGHSDRARAFSAALRRAAELLDLIVLEQGRAP